MIAGFVWTPKTWKPGKLQNRIEAENKPPQAKTVDDVVDDVADVEENGELTP